MKGLSGRTRQRSYALRVLYEMEMNDMSAEEVLNSRRLAGEGPPGEFALELIDGVARHQGEFDRLIADYVEGWEPSRMPPLDRSIIRMSLFELFFKDDIPAGATIDEAVELAKTFSTSDSGRFVNGVLGRINRDREEGKLNLSGE